MKHILLSFFLFAFVFFNLLANPNAAYLKIEEIRYDENMRFPYIVSENPAMDNVANKINKRLQSIIFYSDEEIINNSNLNSIEQHLFIRNDEIDQSGISQLDYTCKIYTRFLEVVIDIDWAGGPYPVGAETNYLYFELQTGEYITLPDLIDGTKYFDFLKTFWIEDCSISIRESHQCAHGNDTDDYDSKEAYTLDGPCEFQCHKISNGLKLSLDTIQISNNSNCFPHVWQNCNYGASKHIKIDLIKSYLSGFGKWIFGIENTYKPVEEVFHFVGKVDGKYKISMTIFATNETLMKGTYFYWSQNKKIPVDGQVISETLYLSEFSNNELTASFELEWDDFLYSTEGFWENKKTNKKLPVNIMVIYDYRDRNYHR